jgi:hypothetical protein
LEPARPRAAAGGKDGSPPRGLAARQWANSVWDVQDLENKSVSNVDPIRKPFCLLLERRGFPRRPEPEAAPLHEASMFPDRLLSGVWGLRVSFGSESAC